VLKAQDENPRRGFSLELKQKANAFAFAKA